MLDRLIAPGVKGEIKEAGLRRILQRLLRMDAATGSEYCECKGESEDEGAPSDDEICRWLAKRQRNLLLPETERAGGIVSVIDAAADDGDDHYCETPIQQKVGDRSLGTSQYIEGAVQAAVDQITEGGVILPDKVLCLPPLGTLF